MTRFLICAFFTLILLAIFFAKVYWGISISGRWSVLLFAGLSAVAHAWGILGAKGKLNFKYRLCMIASFTTPGMAVLLTFFWSPLLTLYTIGVVVNLLGFSNHIYYADDRYIITKAVSFSTDSIYLVSQNEGVFAREIGSFYSDMDLSEAEVSVAGEVITINNGEESEAHTF